MNLVGMLLDEPADRGLSFGEPRTVVEQLAGSEERAQIDGHDSDPQLGQLVDLAAERLSDRRIARRDDRVARHSDHDVGRRHAGPLATKARLAGRRCHPRPRASRTRSTSAASCAVKANTETQSSERQAGTTPTVLTSPRVGFRPTMLPSAAGIRPDPAVSVPSANGTSPEATATPEPELEPPGTIDESKGLVGVP